MRVVLGVRLQFTLADAEACSKRYLRYCKTVDAEKRSKFRVPRALFEEINNVIEVGPTEVPMRLWSLALVLQCARE